MLRNLFLTFIVAFVTSASFAQQNEKPKIYDPTANVEADMKAVMEKAQKENKHILVQVGGNWCGWCIKFHEYVKSDSALLKLMNDNYVVYHLNYSQENKNEEYIKKLGYVQRFGFPVFVVLDQKGNKLHIQDSGLLEEGSTYDRKKVLSFFKGWTKAAVDPASYKNF